MVESKLEETFAWHLSQALPRFPYVREYKFCPNRRWRADFVFVEQNLIVEVEGGIWTDGRHTRGSGFEKDCEKYNAAVIAGFRVLRVTGAQIKSGQALEWVEQALTGFKKAENINQRKRRDPC